MDPAIWAQDRSQYSMPAGSLPVKGKTVTLHNRTLLQLVATAYRMRLIEVTGPGWMSSLRFDIDAKLPADAASRDANEMLQVLLEDRFALRTHRETRNLSGLALVVGKNGPRLPPSSETQASPSQDEMQHELQRRMERLAKQSRQMSGPAWMWQSNSATAAEIAQALSNLMHLPVVDQTSLPGRYEVSLELPPPEAPDEPLESRANRAVASLGLKLESRKVPVTVLVVDAASKAPTEN
jgi:uncharacterized protein (TIGR03435 family)